MARLDPRENIPDEWDEQAEYDLAYRYGEWELCGKRFYETRRMYYLERKANRRARLTNTISIIAAVAAIIAAAISIVNLLI